MVSECWICEVHPPGIVQTSDDDEVRITIEIDWHDWRLQGQKLLKRQILKCGAFESSTLDEDRAYVTR